MGLLGDVISSIGAGRRNKQNIKFQSQTRDLNRQWDVQDYERQRSDALDDQERINRYNSPQQQMQRLKEAGINPHLAFGKGGQESISAEVRGSQMGHNTSTAPQATENPMANFSGTYPIMDDMIKSIAMKQGEANVSKTAKESELLDMEKTTVGLKQLGEMLNQKIAGEDYKERQFRVQNLQKMQDQLIENYQADRQAKITGSNVAVSENARQQQLQQYRIASAKQDLKTNMLKQSQILIDSAKSQEEIAQIKQNTKYLQESGQLKKLETELKKRGLDGSDPFYIKMTTIALTRGMNAALDALKSYAK